MNKVSYCSIYCIQFHKMLQYWRMKLSHAGLETVLYTKYFKFTSVSSQEVFWYCFYHTLMEIFQAWHKLRPKWWLLVCNTWSNHINTIKNSSCNVETAHFKFEVAILNLKWDVSHLKKFEFIIFCKLLQYIYLAEVVTLSHWQLNYLF